MFYQNITLCFIIFSVFVQLSLSLDCYQCSGSDSKKPFQCNEWLSNDIDIAPEPCDNVFGAKYCIKHVGRFEGGIGTKRFCSSLDLGNYCNYVKQPGDSLTYRTCLYTCTGDGCNPAASKKPQSLLLLMTIAGIVFYRMI
ncbi:UPAR/Ly6 domain-containing protein bou isoform X1 [Diabrotica undecimpunctata]|uniref:UPAR/Ly6 domain-containing protein bou isoform X1 n=1 Tax=Diabrotica undecimpunctata TaxID=50387 RepID=UPI003B635CC8